MKILKHLIYIVIILALISVIYTRRLFEIPKVIVPDDVQIMAYTHFFNNLRDGNIFLYVLDSVPVQDSVFDKKIIDYEVDGVKVRIRPVKRYPDNNKLWIEGYRFQVDEEYIHYNHDIFIQYLVRAVFDMRFEYALKLSGYLQQVKADIPNYFKFEDEFIYSTMQNVDMLNNDLQERVHEFNKNILLYSGVRNFDNFNIDLLVDPFYTNQDSVFSEDDLYGEFKINRRLNSSHVTLLSQLVMEGEDIDKYEVMASLRAINRISDRVSFWSPDMPEINKLSQIDPKYIDVLLDFSHSTSSYRFKYAMNSALSRIATDEHKPVILKALKSNRDLIQLVINKGWIKDAKSIIQQSLSLREKWYSVEWIKAAAMLEDTTMYEDLREYLKNGSNRKHTFDAIRYMKGMVVDDVIAYLWNNKIDFSSSYAYPEALITQMAIELGYKDALEHYIKSVTFDLDEMFYSSDYVRKLFDVTDDYPSMIGWYKIHKDKISFNKKTMKWELL